MQKIHQTARQKTLMKYACVKYIRKIQTTCFPFNSGKRVLELIEICFLRSIKKLLIMLIMIRKWTNHLMINNSLITHEALVVEWNIHKAYVKIKFRTNCILFWTNEKTFIKRLFIKRMLTCCISSYKKIILNLEIVNYLRNLFKLTSLKLFFCTD